MGERPWRGPTAEVYPEGVPGFDLSHPEESFDDLVDALDDMPASVAHRTLGNALALAASTFGVLDEEANPRREAREHFGGERRMARLVNLVAGHMLRAAKFGVQSTLTIQDWLRIRTAHEGACAYCGKRTKRLTIDHYTPMSRGGPNTPDNVVASCWTCNVRKGTKEPGAWMRAAGLDVDEAARRIREARASQVTP